MDKYFKRKTDEEFYLLMEKKREEIDSINISEEEKDHLYSLLQNNINYYESSKKSSIQQERVNEAYDFFGESLKNFINVTNELTKQNNSLHIIHVNQQIQIVKYNRIKEQIEESIEIQKKLESKLTIELIKLQMKNQIHI